MTVRKFNTDIGEILIEAETDDSGAHINLYLDKNLVGHAVVDIWELLNHDSRIVLYGFGDGANFTVYGRQQSDGWVTWGDPTATDGWAVKEEEEV